MDFKGKICPYCKGEFKEDDEVVICSACEMPHHKECWIQNQGCTTFGCAGTIMGEASILFCEECGTVYKEGEEVCSACGNVLPKVNMQNIDYNINSSRNIEQDIYTYIGTNQEYFLKKFEKLDQKGSKASWNWASAFFGGYWYAYRKMYLMQFLYYVMYLFTVVFLDMLAAFTFMNTHYSMSRSMSAFGSMRFLISMMPFVISGRLGTYIYKCHVEKHVKRAESMDDHMRENYLVEKGGTNTLAIFIIIIISVLIGIIRSLN